jgi:hypothetical protein
VFVPPDHEAALRVIRDAFLSTLQWPTLSFVRRELHTLHSGSLEALEDALGDLIVVDFSHRDDARVRVTVAGLWSIDRGSQELRHFIRALRGCYDVYCASDLGSPSEPNEIVVSGATLLKHVPEADRDRIVQVVGLLLDVERIGPVTWPTDPRAPFEIVLDSGILAYGRVGRVPDYLEVRATL